MLVFAQVPPDLHSVASSQSAAFFLWHSANTGGRGNVTEGGGAALVTVSDAPSARASSVRQRSCLSPTGGLTSSLQRGAGEARGFLHARPHVSDGAQRVMTAKLKGGIFGTCFVQQARKFYC